MPEPSPRGHCEFLPSANQALADLEQATGKPVLVITRPDKAGELRYRLAVPKCTTWNRVGDMKLAPWPKPPDHAEAS